MPCSTRDEQQALFDAVALAPSFMTSWGYQNLADGLAGMTRLVSTCRNFMRSKCYWNIIWATVASSQTKPAPHPVYVNLGVCEVGCCVLVFACGLKPCPVT